MCRTNAKIIASQAMGVLVNSTSPTSGRSDKKGMVISSRPPGLVLPWV